MSQKFLFPFDSPTRFILEDVHENTRIRHPDDVFYFAGDLLNPDDLRYIADFIENISPGDKIALKLTTFPA